MIEGEQACEARQQLLHARQMEFLKQASPDDWHRYAWHHNWDDRLDGLFWIVSQPECDRATAVMIFWKGEAGGYDYETEEEEMGSDIYAVAPMLRFIAERFNTTGYPRAELAYDALVDHGEPLPEHVEMVRAGRLRDIKDLIERQESMADPTIRLHPDLQALHIPGRKVGGFGEENAFYDRFPYLDEGGDETESSDVSSVVALMAKNFDKGEAGREDDASARIRALRRKADVTMDDVPSARSPSGLLTWIRSLRRH